LTGIYTRIKEKRLREELRQENGIRTKAETYMPSWTLSGLIGHWLAQPDFVRVVVSEKSENNKRSRIQSKLCRYDLGHERKLIAKIEP
jgi:hypothetical protein